MPCHATQFQLLPANWLVVWVLRANLILAMAPQNGVRARHNFTNGEEVTRAGWCGLELEPLSMGRLVHGLPMYQSVSMVEQQKPMNRIAVPIRFGPAFPSILPVSQYGFAITPPISG